MIFLLKIYQRTLSWDHYWRFRVGGQRLCRYYPSCSDYAIGCIERYGFWRGGAKAVIRLLRCNPFSRGGYHPVV